MAIGGGVPDLPNLIGTHHKTGTIWMHETFLRFAEASGLRLSALSEKQIQQERTMPSSRSMSP